MSFRELTKEYLRALEEFHRESVRVAEMTGELSYRPCLNAFFEKIPSEFGDHIASVYEPRQQGRAGRPDWRFYDKRSLGLFGYVEAKAFSSDTPIVVDDYIGQVGKYLTLGYKVILTDGLEFLFFNPSDMSHRRYSLVNKCTNGTLTSRISSDLVLLESEFDNYFANIAARRISEQQLVSDCAIRARYLADEIETLSNLPLGSGLNEGENEAIAILSELMDVVQKHHDPLLRNKKVFSAFVSQILIFGLIYAHRVLGVESMEPSERYDKLKQFWLDDDDIEFTSTLKPFRALTKLLRDEIASVGSLGVWYEDCCFMLSHVELREEQVTTPDYHGLFEKFLEAFDPKTRFDYGAYYTPKELSGYLVALVEEINGRVFNGNLYDKGNRLIDPCCGTGSFLERLLLASTRSGGEATLIGFEILPAPYALAHYRMVKVSPEYPDVNIVLTNTLSDAIESTPTVSAQPNLFDDEQEAARNFAKPPLVLVIGNPPASEAPSHSTGPNFRIIERLLEDFRPPETSRRSRSNIQKQVKNDFVKFLRWSGNKALESGNSIVALILPSSFAEHTTYKYARSWFVKNFDRFWVLDIDKDARTGVRSSGVFHTLQGRLLFVAVRYTNHRQETTRSFNYLSVADFNLDEKNAFFEVAGDAGEVMLDQFESFDIDLENPIFRPRKSIDRDIYDQFWSLYKQEDSEEVKYIFERHCSAIKLAPTHFFVHADGPVLIRRSREIADTEIMPDEIISRWYAGQRKAPKAAKFTSAVRSAFARELQKNPDKPISQYSYRPMMNLPAIISEDILSTLANAPGKGTRYRPEILSAYSDERTMAIAVAPAPQDLGSELHRFASFSWYLPDNDLSMRGNAQVLCNYFPEYKKLRGQWDSTPHLNINRDFLAAAGESSPDKALFYVYGILCSSVYLDAFEPVLFTTAGGEPPRIPLPTSHDLFIRIAALGEELALLEKHTAVEDMFIEDQYEPYLLEIQSDFKMTGFKIDVENESIELSGDRARLEIKPVPNEILNFYVGGYQVLQQWLKMHSYVYTRTAFTRKHLRKLLFLLQSLQKQVDIINQLDDFVRPLLASFDTEASVVH